MHTIRISDGSIGIGSQIVGEGIRHQWIMGESSESTFRNNSENMLSHRYQNMISQTKIPVGQTSDREERLETQTEGESAAHRLRGRTENINYEETYAEEVQEYEKPQGCMDSASSEDLRATQKSLRQNILFALSTVNMANENAKCQIQDQIQNKEAETPLEILNSDFYY